MTIEYLFGLTIMAIIMIAGVGLSAWKGEFNKNHNPCSNNCCNPDHWNDEDRKKLTTEQYNTMKQNIENFKKSER